MVEVFLLGLALGVGEALAVGPLFVAIVHESATRGFRAGCGVILGSTATDATLLPLLLLGAGALALVPGLLPWLGIAGVCGLLGLGLAAGRDALRLWRGKRGAQARVSRSFRRGLATALANPLGWVLWLGADLPALLRAREAGGPGGVFLFVAAWFGASVAVEVALAGGAARAGRGLNRRGRACLSAGSAGIYLALAAGLLASSVLPRAAGG